MKTSLKSTTFLSILIALFLSACTSSSEPKLSKPVNVEFTLQTIMENGKLGYRGIGGDIDGIINPDLVVHPGDAVRVILVNGDGMQHDLFLPGFNTKTKFVSKIGERTTTAFEVKDMEPGDYAYYCTVPGHRQAGQEGKLIVAKP